MRKLKESIALILAMFIGSLLGRFAVQILRHGINIFGDFDFFFLELKEHILPQTLIGVAVGLPILLLLGRKKEK